MKAATHTKYGPPEVLHVKDISIPTPGEDEVLVKVHATTVNRTDTGFRSAQYVVSRLFSGLLKPKNQVLGCEYAGEITEVGAAVKDFKKGDRVFGFDDVEWGGHAEYKVAKQDGMISTIPKGMSFTSIAPATEGAHYALQYMRAANIGKGTTVLMHGGTGAIGSAAIQIMAHAGAHVAATSPTKHIELVKKLGASRVFDWQKNDISKINDTFEVVFDAVGKSSFSACKDLIKPGGVYMSTELGAYGQNPLLALSTHFFGSKKVLFPLPKNSRADIEYLKELIEQKSYTPLIDTTYGLDDIVDATKYVESGQKIGNVVIKIT